MQKHSKYLQSNGTQIGAAISALCSRPMIMSDYTNTFVKLNGPIEPTYICLDSAIIDYNKRDKVMQIENG